MKVFIIGKITARTFAQDFEKFIDAEAQLIQSGHEVVNIFNTITDKFDVLENESQHRLALLLECDAVLVLSDWSDSEECHIELINACHCGMKVLPANGTIIPPRLTIHLNN